MNKYYGVVYLSDGTIHLWPGDTQEECLDTLYTIKDKFPPSEDRSWEVVATTVIKRDLDSFKYLQNIPMIFGMPKSLDVMQTPRKKKK